MTQCCLFELDWSLRPVLLVKPVGSVLEFTLCLSKTVTTGSGPYVGLDSE